MKKDNASIAKVYAISDRSIKVLTLIVSVTFLSLKLTFAQQVMEVDKYLQDLNTTDPGAASNVEKMVYGVQPTVYLQQGAFMLRGGEQAVVANISAAEIGELQAGHESLETVSLLMIDFSSENELQSFQLDTSHLSSLPNLGYVLLSLKFEQSAVNQSSLFRGLENSPLIFLYESTRTF